MNITIQNAEMLISKIVLLISYFMTIPIVGYCRAWVAEKMGDDTPTEFGFKTLNPIAHVSWLWVTLMVCIPSFDFGFGKYIPINPINIQGRNRGWKLAAAYLSDAFASITLATFALFVLVFFYGPRAFEYGLVLLHGALSGGVHNTFSSYGIAFSLLFTGFIIFNSMLAAFNIIVNLFYLCFFYYFDNNAQSAEHIEWIMLVGPLLLIICFFGVVQFSILQLVAGMGSLFALVMGIK